MPLDEPVVPVTPEPKPPRDVVYALVAIAVLVLTVVPVGTAVFWLGFARGDSPCVMCWEQRIGMLLISLVGLFVLRFGPRPKYVGMAVLIAVWGMFMGMRHTGMHAARDIGQGFSLEIMGAHTYTWALFIYWVCAFAMGLLLLLVRPAHLDSGVRTPNLLEKFTFGAFMLVVAANIVQAFASTGPPPYMGQSDPMRFTFNPVNWHWSLEEWKPVKLGLRGRWAVDKPNLAQAAANPLAGPMASLPPLVAKERRTLTLSLDGAPTDFTFDATSQQFLVTTATGVYLTDAALTKVTRQTIVDAGYSVDLSRFAGAAFLDAGELIAVGENKSYVVLKPNDAANAYANFRYFTSSADRFDEVARGRFSTVRARLLYIQSAAYDSASHSLYTVTVPNNLVKRMVVSRFDRRDLTLSEEFVPTLAPASGLTLGKDRSLGEFMVTGATIVGGELYAVSAAYSALLVIDLTAKQVTAAYAIPDLVRPIGITAKGDDLFILGEDMALTVIPRPKGVAH
jgi:disulfide bond formation protein DsbB